ncbi:MAG: hypothetical protein K0S07_355 [Chlamydiales bacterium]|jgi:hypothetical protein|nr:hypothetical protein [Chlamydiales bacterium]
MHLFTLLQRQEKRRRALFSLYWVISIAFFSLMVKNPWLLGSKPLLAFLGLELSLKLSFSKLLHRQSPPLKTMGQSAYQALYFLSYLAAAKIFGNLGFYCLALVAPSSRHFWQKIAPSKKQEAVKAHALKPMELFSLQERWIDARLLQGAFLLWMIAIAQLTGADVSQGEGLVLMSSALNISLLCGQALSSLIGESASFGWQFCKFALERFSALSLVCLGFPPPSEDLH